MQSYPGKKTHTPWNHAASVSQIGKCQVYCHVWTGRRNHMLIIYVKGITTLHKYGYEYPIQYVSDTRIRTFSIKSFTKMVYPRIRIRVSNEYRIRIRYPLEYPCNIGGLYWTSGPEPKLPRFYAS
jgi:hypothetical protein